MNRIYNWIVVLITAISSPWLVSCEDQDSTQAMVLSGQWTGNFGMYYDYEYRGRVYSFDADYTDIVFYPQYDFATYGWGKQVDYYYDGPYAFQYYRFYWNVDRGVIYLRYPGAPELNAVISDYRMNNDRLTGWFEGTDSRFSLYKLVDYYDWTPYVEVYGYEPMDWVPDYYYDSRVAGDDSISVRFDAADGRVLRRGCRFKAQNLGE